MRRDQMHEPPHPGEILRELCLVPLKLSAHPDGGVLSSVMLRDSGPCALPAWSRRHSVTMRTTIATAGQVSSMHGR